MANKPHPIVAGNWKMNGLSASLAQIEAMAQGYDAPLKSRVELLICPPATLVGAAIATAGGRLSIGGQDCHQKASGAHTGDVSASMLADLGATFVIVGHSERRTDHAESSELVKAKAEAALAAGLIAILCVGETDAERKAGRTLDVVGAQIADSLPAGATAANLVLAYEPVWAIGTGLTPTAADVADVHAFIRAELARALGAEGAGVRILYGGSVKPSNAVELMGVANVDGALVGGASLTSKDFLGIAAAYR
jgi:triosephosphate isomerase